MKKPKVTAEDLLLAQQMGSAILDAENTELIVGCVRTLTDAWNSMPDEVSFTDGLYVMSSFLTMSAHAAAAQADERGMIDLDGEQIRFSNTVAGLLTTMLFMSMNMEVISVGADVEEESHPTH